MHALSLFVQCKFPEYAMHDELCSYSLSTLYVLGIQ